MPIIQIKPMSVNRAYNGKKVKSKAYRIYEKSIAVCLPRLTIPDGDLKLSLEVGFSSPLADLDNAIKPFQDILQNKYSFNDRRITELHAVKKMVSKNREYIRFTISEANNEC